MALHILHLANDFPGSRVYNQLVQAIDLRGVQQTIFTTIRSEDGKGKNAVDFATDGSTIYYSDNWRPWHRAFFRLKTRSNYKHLLRSIDPKTITHVHAHTLFSDGVLALKLKKDYGIPYTVTIRDTDINVFMKWMWHTWYIGWAVIQNADKVVCISPAHIKRVEAWRACPREFASKTVNIPNGVNSYWLEQISCDLKSHQRGDTWHFLYVGRFTSRKNLPRLMQAILSLKDKGDSLDLHIVGGKGDDTKRIETLAKRHPEVFYLHGVVQDKEKIRAIMQQCHIFTMPSLTETFGLVYVEALSQGLPILYTEGEGVDGFFSSSYGERCNPKSVQDIAEKLERMLSHYEEYSIDDSYLKEHFDWDIVADKYLAIMELDKKTTRNCNR
ncbi:glycosyltransferase family 4 protein [Porphyromonas asaccharolytica]|uniref:Glycosyl transferase group 1 n=1 Tax=Porphyromonas asaccharolytica (strain ATCC 25260 / DSM 20707 / BCRC 10618 / CCUG 7834 / JCM 6326 / LMG 13178 / VPI 4198 / B440) TaxID=879243 RepID=F4KKI2_PORAD|nr:glycosyltransferase family 4 protein [Porphyromonas asaccharolytica]AEE12907.1 glycosyl transferase group 1 [Porphyromonas asaccharolytica DSM 20707]